MVALFTVSPAVSAHQTPAADLSARVSQHPPSVWSSAFPPRPQYQRGFAGLSPSKTILGVPRSSGWLDLLLKSLNFLPFCPPLFLAAAGTSPAAGRWSCAWRSPLNPVISLSPAVATFSKMGLVEQIVHPCYSEEGRRGRETRPRWL